MADDETPHETPGETPHETPMTLPALFSNSRKNSLTNSSPNREEIGRHDIPSGEEEEEAAEYNNSYLVGTSRKHPGGYFRKASGAPRRGESRVDLSKAEGKFMWTCLRAYGDRLAFLKGSTGHRLPSWPSRLSVPLSSARSARPRPRLRPRLSARPRKMPAG